MKQDGGALFRIGQPLHRFLIVWWNRWYQISPETLKCRSCYLQIRNIVEHISVLSMIYSKTWRFHSNLIILPSSFPLWLTIRLFVKKCWYASPVMI